jgi:hypothetical protein
MSWHRPEWSRPCLYLDLINEIKDVLARQHWSRPCFYLYLSNKIKDVLAQTVVTPMLYLDLILTIK